MNAKPILEVRAIIFDREQEDSYRYELNLKYKYLTNNEYHIIILFTDADSVNFYERKDYPLLRVI